MSDRGKEFEGGEVTDRTYPSGRTVRRHRRITVYFIIAIVLGILALIYTLNVIG